MWKPNYKKPAELGSAKDNQRREDKEKGKDQDSDEIFSGELLPWALNYKEPAELDKLYIDEIFSEEILQMIVERIQCATNPVGKVGIAGALQVKPFNKAITNSPQVRFWNHRLEQVIPKRGTWLQKACLVPHPLDYEQTQYNHTLNPTYQQVHNAFKAHHQLFEYTPSLLGKHSYFIRYSLPIIQRYNLLVSAVLFMFGPKSTWIPGLFMHLGSNIFFRVVIAEHMEWHEIQMLQYENPKITRMVAGPDEGLHPCQLETALFGLKQRLENSYYCGDNLKQFLITVLIKKLELFMVMQMQTKVDSLANLEGHAFSFIIIDSKPEYCTYFLALQKELVKLEKKLTDLENLDDKNLLTQQLKAAPFLSELKNNLYTLTNLFNGTIDDDQIRIDLLNIQPRLKDIEQELVNTLKELGEELSSGHEDDISDEQQKAKGLRFSP